MLEKNHQICENSKFKKFELPPLHMQILGHDQFWVFSFCLLADFQNVCSTFYFLSAKDLQDYICKWVNR